MALDKFTAIDVYRVVAFPLNNDGTFDLEEDYAGGVEDLYQGVEFEGPTSFDVSFGAPRQIPVVAQGQVQDTFILPSTEAKTGIIRTAYDKLTLNAMLTGNLVTTIGEGKFMEEDTSKAGTEKLVALLLQQLQAHDESGNTVWRSDVIHRARIVPSPTGYNDAVLLKEYNLALSRSTKRMWGETFTIATHGHTEAVKSYGITTDLWNIGVWMGNGSLTAFNLPADKPGKSSASAKVWDFDAGGARAGSWNAGMTIFTPTVTPPDGTVLVVTYEVAP